MLDPVAIFTAAVFLMAGLAKGVIGLGLPTISMGLLAISLRPVAFNPTGSCLSRD
jgi:hypothetical protein